MPIDANAPDSALFKEPFTMTYEDPCNVLSQATKFWNKAAAAVWISKGHKSLTIGGAKWMQKVPQEPAEEVGRHGDQMGLSFVAAGHGTLQHLGASLLLRGVKLQCEISG